MTICEYLRQMRETVPAWLAGLKDGDAFPREDFFRSRIVYYPGSGKDGHPVKVFGSTHSSHVFVYADYHFTQEALENELGDPTRGFRGYHSLSRMSLHETDLVPRGWIPHIDPTDASPNERRLAARTIVPFGFLEVLERERDLGDEHGAPRLAILFLGADGIATYDALFCQEDSVSAPFAVVVQDHAFGGNYDRFGGGGLLERLARRCQAMPEWLLVAKYTNPWAGWDRVPEVDGDCGGMNNNYRCLYEGGKEH